MLRKVAPWLAAAVSLVACDGTLSFDVSAGPKSFDIGTEGLGIPAELRTPEAQVASLPCGDGAFVCPSVATFSIECVGGVCDPGPIPVAVEIGDGFDLEQYTTKLGDIADRIESVTFNSVSYAVESNTLNTDLPLITVYWGPMSAAFIDESMGVMPLGSIEPIAAGSTPSGQILLDDFGQQALSDHIVAVDRQLRLFARAPIDIDPGDRFPEGAVRMSVTMSLHIVGETKLF
ncbi:MAG: hypothetical protein IT379_23300 [Deltaproteobacteria bacterium]|nr:hypothetical protein [Deltaproteobacteria bacterium]